MGIFDCTEWSGKAGTNAYKTLAVINKYVYFIWVDPMARGRRNDREQYTASDLYMNAGKYFSPGELLASDGGFKGDGNLIISIDNLNTDEQKIFNLAFKKVRVGVKNAFGSVQMWLPILGLLGRFFFTFFKIPAARFGLVWLSSGGKSFNLQPSRWNDAYTRHYEKFIFALNHSEF